ncbi:hypothetical protein BEWA_039880 [Theileria equi strain WA]|uniref:Uncharacterized protein n=1 Tax=Theileria equi strain WA TaxID=1537102 RepID=L1LFC3_THEEQ|nr:hypothetical protein BEWA_039880 [Theileria equi strain WA]EKX73950.1 hypothetical protein BEWA_039880 [Theileria equi strain WA]|eukprot:XP_004833402.1 hypothetical protein BEWA_039880 [Theileria equi strain WA]
MDVPPFIRVSLQVCDGLENKLSKFVRVGAITLQNPGLAPGHGLEEGENASNPIKSTQFPVNKDVNSEFTTSGSGKGYTLQNYGPYSKHIVNCNVEDITNYTLFNAIPGINEKLKSTSEARNDQDDTEQKNEWHVFRDSDYLSHNLKNLSERTFNKVKLRTKLVKILTHRILSVKDHFSPSQLSRLIFAICNSDMKFAPLLDELCQTYLQHCENRKFDALNSLNESERVSFLACSEYAQRNSKLGSTALVIDESIIRHLLVLSSISLYRKNTTAITVHHKGSDSCTENPPTKEPTAKPNPLNSTDDLLRRAEARLLSFVEEQINSNLSRETILLSLQTMIIYDGSNEGIVKKLLQIVNVDDFTISELCTLMHSCTLLSKISDNRIHTTIESALERITKMVREGARLPTSELSQMFHFFYLSGRLEHELMDELCNIAVKEHVKFDNNTEFYRTTFPLAVSNKLRLPDVGKWILHEMASNSNRYILDISQFLFMLTSVGSAIKLEKNTKPLDFEDDIYEKALMYLKGSFYFPSNKSALKHLFEKALEVLPKCTGDQFVQFTQAFTHPIVKRDTRLKLQLLKECRDRVNTINPGGILHVVEFILWLYGKNTDAITAVNLYKEKALSDITAYNVGGLVAETTIYMDSFLTDVSILSNLVYLFNWCDLNSPDLALEVATLISANDCKMIYNATLGQLSQIFHYLACSMPKHEVYDVLAIMILDRLSHCSPVSRDFSNEKSRGSSPVNVHKTPLVHSHSEENGSTFPCYAEDLIIILEALLVTSLAPRYKQLLDKLEEMSLAMTGSTKVMKTLAQTLSKVTNMDYTIEEGDESRVIPVS